MRMKVATRPTAAYSCSDVLPGSFLRTSGQLPHAHQPNPVESCLTHTAERSTLSSSAL